MQTIKQRRGVIGVGQRTGTRTAIDRVGGRPAEYIDVAGIVHRQHAIIVLQ